MNIIETLTQLVAIDSVSSHSNAEIISFLSNRCEALGLAVKRFPYRDENGIEKINLIALAGTDFSDTTNVELALVGHTDTVPYDLSWREATTLVQRDGKLYGRGACDTKAFIAAALTAVEAIGLKRMPSRPLALIFTADEEVGLIGAKRLAEARPLTARYSIVGEPTSLQPMRAGKGYCLAEVVVRGREGHSAYPASGASAIFRAARLISRIETISEEIKSEQHRSFDPPYTTLNVGLIHGGTAKNVIAGECRFTLEWRPIPGQGSDRVLDLVRLALAEVKLDLGFDSEVVASRADGGFETKAYSPLVKMLEQLTGKRSSTVAFGTEAAQMIALGADAVVMGPGDIRTAHQTNEFVPIDELERCATILKNVIDLLCLDR